jgi:RNA polymerase sigma-32 factor
MRKKINKTVAKKQHKEDIIDVFEDVQIDGLLPKVIESLPVLRHSTDLKVQDPMTFYLKEISRHKLLTIEEERELTAELLRTGDIEVAKKLVLANLRLVVKIALEYKNAYRNVMDLIQEGNIGLMKAVSKYDPSKGAKLSYYASWWIRSYILKFILDNFRLVKIGTTQEQKKLFYNLMREKQRLMSMGITPDVKLLSENLGVSEKAVIEMDHRLGSGGQELSLDRPLEEDGGTQTLNDLIGADEEQLDEKLADLQNLGILKERLGDFIKNLKTRDQEIFKKRLLSEIPESLQSIADQYGVSRERIRQVEERLIEQLKIYMSEFLR